MLEELKKMMDAAALKKKAEITPKISIGPLENG